MPWGLAAFTTFVPWLSGNPPVDAIGWEFAWLSSEDISDSEHWSTAFSVEIYCQLNFQLMGFLQKGTDTVYIAFFFYQKARINVPSLPSFSINSGVLCVECGSIHAFYLKAKFWRIWSQETDLFFLPKKQSTPLCKKKKKNPSITVDADHFYNFP